MVKQFKHIRMRLNRKTIKRINSSSTKYGPWWNGTISRDLGGLLKTSRRKAASLGGIISPLLFKGSMLSCVRAHGRYCSRLRMRPSPMLCDELKESASIRVREMSYFIVWNSLTCYNRKSISAHLLTWNGNAFEFSMAPLSCHWFKIFLPPKWDWPWHLS